MKKAGTKWMAGLWIVTAGIVLSACGATDATEQTEPISEALQTEESTQQATVADLLDGVSGKEVIRLNWKDEEDASQGYIEMFADGFLNQEIPVIQALYHVPDRELSKWELELLAMDGWNLGRTYDLVSEKEIQKAVCTEICFSLIAKDLDRLDELEEPSPYRFYIWFILLNMEEDKIAEYAEWMYATEEEALSVYRELVDSVDAEQCWNDYVSIMNTMSYQQIQAELNSCTCGDGLGCVEEENRNTHAIYQLIRKIAEPYTKEYILNYCEENDMGTFTEDTLQILEQYE